MTMRCSSHIDELGRSHCCFRHQAPSRTLVLPEVKAIDLRFDKRVTSRRMHLRLPQLQAGPEFGFGLRDPKKCKMCRRNIATTGRASSIHELRAAGVRERRIMYLRFVSSSELV
jgi:hypothetical protein